MIIQGGESGQVAKNGKLLEKQYQTVDTDNLEYCWKHPITLTSDWKNPNEWDKKKLDKIKLLPREIVEKDGTVNKFRICPSCWLIVPYTKVP